METLEQALGAAPGGEHPLRAKLALVLGAGGVGKAVAYGLLARGAEVVLCDGDNSRAGRLAQRLQCAAVAWDRRLEVTADVLVNCTPVGMYPKAEETPLERRFLRPGMTVFDVVYNPEHTLLLRDAQRQGCLTVSGVEMFVRQACLQFQRFTGINAPADLMRQVTRDVLAE